MDGDGEPHDGSHARRGSKKTGEALGFSVHAYVHIAAGDKAGRERLARYVTRPPLADASLSLTRDGRVAVKLRRPRGGSTHIVLEPVRFLRRLAWLVPHPGRHQTLYYGVLAPSSSWRTEIVPGYGSTGKSCQNCQPLGDPEELVLKLTRSGAAAIPWRALLARVYDNLDALECDNCGGRLRPIAVIMEPEAAKKILRHLGLPADSPTFAPARAPP